MHLLIKTKWYLDGTDQKDGTTVYYCEVDGEPQKVDNVTLSVYRREFDGSFTEIGTDLPNGNRHVPDPHPSLDLARYRIVAIQKDTGSISFTDVSEEWDKYAGIVLKWDEEWSEFDVSEDEEGNYQLEQPPVTGSMLVLPYNIKVSDNNDKDVELIEYIGREHPVSYYGTQVGQKATWSFEIDKEDVDTLYGLRRLSRWMGNVYVREPSGSGYWATVSVSFSQSYDELTIPVSLSLTRVEGGV